MELTKLKQRNLGESRPESKELKFWANKRTDRRALGKDKRENETEIRLHCC
jgi:hypothetical protein